MQKTLDEKLSELSASNFSEKACFDFFGSLTENEIKQILEKLETEDFAFLGEKQKQFMRVYLNKLLEKIEEIKKQA